MYEMSTPPGLVLAQNSSVTGEEKKNEQLILQFT